MSTKPNIPGRDPGQEQDLFQIGETITAEKFNALYLAFTEKLNETAFSGNFDLQVNGSKLQKRYGTGSFEDVLDTNTFVGPQGIPGIQGIPGDQGIQGIQGIPGPQGDLGIQGIKGDNGDIGLTGPQGIQGAQGLSAYQIATNGGFVGTESQWLSSLQGAQGPQGIQGLIGTQGDQGIQGIQGIQGVQGEVGSQGIKGDTGDTGLQGDIGPQGIQGIQGPIGLTGLTGEKGNDGTGVNILGSFSTEAELPLTGSSGDAYLIQGFLYVWDPITSGYINAGNIQGPSGPQGIQGIQGPQGVIGPAGPQGEVGLKGDTGDNGLQGIQGIQGIQGETGPQGIQGVKGDTGDQGLIGLTGPQGVTGNQGEIGPEGPQGNVGDSAYQFAVSNGFIGTEAEWLTSLEGAQGIQGIQGEAGPQGIKGDTGNQGIQGVAGTNGTNGTNGVDGNSAYQLALLGGYVGTESAWLESLQGPQGLQGATGDVGPIGLTGLTGPQGEMGLTGPQGIQGEQGVKGDTGDQGIQGIQGVAGVDGAQGIQGVAGTNGLDGASAYQIAVSNGFVGTESEWISDFETDFDSIYFEQVVKDVAGTPTTVVQPKTTGLISKLSLATGEARLDASAIKNLPDGMDGASAYEIAVVNGFVGTEVQWLASLDGPQGIQGIQGLSGDTGPQGIQGIPGVDGAQGLQGIQGESGAAGTAGASAYQVAVTGGFVGTEAEWIASLVGAQGIQGVAGTNGTNGEQGIQGIQGPSGTNGTNGVDGASAYEVAITNGFVGTEVQWLASLEGPQGIQGIQGIQGNTGDQGLQGIQGVKGDTGEQGIQGVAGTNGTNGEDGASAYQVAVANGFIGTEAEWVADFETKFDSAHFEQVVIDVEGVPTTVVQPKTSGLISKISSATGEARLDASAIKNLPAGSTGLDGESAYEVAVSNGFVGTESEWLTSLIGAQGPQGIQGEDGPAGVGTANYFNTEIVDQSGGTASSYPAITGAINGTNKIFTVSEGVYVSGSLKVYWNGQLQTQGTSEDWVQLSPAAGTFEFIEAPEVGTVITAIYKKSETSTSTFVTVTELNDELALKANVTALNDGLALKANTANAMGTVVHGSTAGTARPSGYHVITWIGSVEPTNSINNDIWYDTTP
jgi:hypothetical protein